MDSLTTKFIVNNEIPNEDKVKFFDNLVEALRHNTKYLNGYVPGTGGIYDAYLSALSNTYPTSSKPLPTPIARG